MAKVVDGLAEHVAAIGLIGGDLGHGEIGLTKRGPSGVHPDKNLGDRFNLQIVGQFDDANMVVDDLAELFQGPENGVLVCPGIGGDIIAGDLEEFGVRGKKVGDIGDPRRVFVDGRVANLELLLDRMKGYTNTDGFVVLGEHFPPQQCGHEGGDTLLAVNEDAFPGRVGSILEPDGGITPGN